MGTGKGCGLDLNFNGTARLGPGSQPWPEAPTTPHLRPINRKLLRILTMDGTSPEKLHQPVLNVGVFGYEPANRQYPFILELIRRVEQQGLRIKLAQKTLTELGMDVRRVAKYVEQNPADAWIPISAFYEVLTWFAGQAVPSYAIFGRRRNVPIASVGPDKVPALRAAVERLIELGHRRIVLLSREERRHPEPGEFERAFLDCLARHGIKAGAFHLPEWQDDPGSLR